MQDLIEDGDRIAFFPPRDSGSRGEYGEVFMAIYKQIREYVKQIF